MFKIQEYIMDKIYVKFIYTSVNKKKKFNNFYVLRVKRPIYMYIYLKNFLSII